MHFSKKGIISLCELKMIISRGLVRLFCCLRTDRNFFRETEKILQQKNKKKKRNISSNTFCAQTFYNTAVMRAIIKKGGERQNVNVCGGGGI